MAFKRFQTDLRLFFWITLAVFVILWFVPVDPFFCNNFQPAVISWVGFFADFFSDPFSIYKSESLVYIGCFSLVFGAIALLVGWIVHCMVVMIRNAMRKKPKNDA
jgi:hypothetical protein